MTSLELIKTPLVCRDTVITHNPTGACFSLHSVLFTCSNLGICVLPQRRNCLSARVKRAELFGPKFELVWDRFTLAMIILFRASHLRLDLKFLLHHDV